MRVVLSAPGVFHHFALARELDGRGHLQRIYTTYPWARVKREHLAPSLVRTFPWIHPAQLALKKRLRLSPSLRDGFDTVNAASFDRYVAATLPACDFFIGMSGSGLRSGLRARRSGATYICDRGSSHVRYQVRVLAEEYARWGCAADHVPTAAIEREEAEYAAADLILVPSEFAFRSFVEMGVAEDKLRKVVLAADVQRFHPVAEPDPDEFCVLYVGQISFRKGIPYLLEAFHGLRHPRKRLRLIGVVEDRIKSYLRTAPLGGVVFEGAQPFESVRRAMSEAHVTVLPSVEDGFGMVLAEAMACGSPVISTVNTGGLDLYRDGLEGFIVPIRDPGAILRALECLAGDPGMLQSLRTAASAKMRELGGWKQYGDTVERLLLGLQARG
jgi:glycosyltransferase involved in cell wall biosynthesis